ncbi:MAG: hypothetical protein R6V49_05430 [Bacteroidales bacterium]
MKQLQKVPWCLLVIFLVMILAPSASSRAQENPFGIFISNNVVSLPVTGLPATTHAQFHPGVDLFTGFRLNQHSRHQWWAHANLGVYYHRFFQTGLRLHGSIDYRYVMSKRLSFDAGLIAGYMHSFTWYDVFEMDGDGDYQKIAKLKGRPQVLGGFRIGVSTPLMPAKAEGLALHLDLRTYLQAPFAGAYIPIIPTNALMLGVSKSLTRKSE